MIRLSKLAMPPVVFIVAALFLTGCPEKQVFENYSYDILPDGKVKTDDAGDCTAKTCEDFPGLCGSQDDGCDGTIECGCASGECVEGECQCTADCEGKVCGDDGCGSSCGECAAGQSCDKGSCDCDEGEACGVACCTKDEVCHEDSCCTPDCDGKDCGDDGCGGSCGECLEGSICSEEGGCACDTGNDYFECQSGCCPAGDICLNSGCCTPTCDGKECGDDGCGGDCGGCGDWGACGADETENECLCQTEKCDGACCAPGQQCGEAGCHWGIVDCTTVLQCLEAKECADPLACVEACPEEEGWPASALTLVECVIDICETWSIQDECYAGAISTECLGEYTTCGGCIPACTDKECGDDGCNGSCGDCVEFATCGEDQQCACDFLLCSETCCAEGAVCFNEQCCTPECTDKNCGDDGCGGTCGECAQNSTCGDDQLCLCDFTGCVDACCEEFAVCVNEACCLPDCTDKECGTDGCDGTCGECGANSTCNAGLCECDNVDCVDAEGVIACCTAEEVCHAQACCTPDCQGKSCGDDGCGGSCGACGINQECKGSEDGTFTCVCAHAECADGCCAENAVCNPGTGTCCMPQCLDKECGTNMCGSTCGDCESFEVCKAGKCECVPDCEGKQCGDDGCGGECGGCEDWQTCLAGMCYGGLCGDLAQCFSDFEGDNPEGLYQMCGEELSDGNPIIMQLVEGLVGCVYDFCDEWDVGSECFTDVVSPNDGLCFESMGLCLEICIPSCNGKQCGPDGCGGDCGYCQGAFCVKDLCGDSCGMVLMCAEQKSCDSEDPSECLSSCFWIPENPMAPPAFGDLYGCVFELCDGWDPMSDCYQNALAAECLSRYADCKTECFPKCDGKECGDNGCGGSCGVCPDGLICQTNGLFECVEDCFLECDDKICGDNGCGGSCGECGDGQKCTPWGNCEPDECEPLCLDKECGPNGCSGLCGECEGDQNCDPNGMCVSCDPMCLTPSGEQAECGYDGCSGQCGYCEPGFKCVEAQCQMEQQNTDCALAFECGLECGGDFGCINECIAQYPDGATAYNVYICLNNQAGCDVIDNGCVTMATGPEGVCANEFEECFGCVTQCEGKQCGSAECGSFQCGFCTPDQICGDDGHCYNGSPPLTDCGEAVECAMGCEDDMMCMMSCSMMHGQDPLQMANMYQCFTESGCSLEDDACIVEIVMEGGQCSGQFNECFECNPQCQGKQCGSAQCGFWECGFCQGGQQCQNGQCVGGGPQGLTCSEFVNCQNECGEDSECFDECAAQVHPSAVDVYNAWIECILEQCPDGADPECVQEAQEIWCVDYMQACLDHVLPFECMVGCYGCEGIKQCYESNCPDLNQDCTQECIDGADATGRFMYGWLQQCLFDDGCDPYAQSPDGYWECFSNSTGPEGQCEQPGEMCMIDNLCDPPCDMKQACISQMCVQGDDCMTLVNCFGDCGPDYECNMQCFDEASPDATMKLEAFNSCLMQECPDGEPGCIEDAQMGICAEPVMMCMDDDSNCSCDGKECGTDGCGQDCGVCGPDWWCDFGKGVCKQEQIPCDDNSDCPDGMICNEEGLCFMVSDCDPACEPGMSCLDGVCIDG